MPRVIHSFSTGVQQTNPARTALWGTGVENKLQELVRTARSWTAMNQNAVVAIDLLRRPHERSDNHSHSQPSDPCRAS